MLTMKKNDKMDTTSVTTTNNNKKMKKQQQQQQYRSSSSNNNNDKLTGQDELRNVFLKMWDGKVRKKSNKTKKNKKRGRETKKIVICLFAACCCCCCCSGRLPFFWCLMGSVGSKKKVDRNFACRKLQRNSWYLLTPSFCRLLFSSFQCPFFFFTSLSYGHWFQHIFDIVSWNYAT